MVVLFQTRLNLSRKINWNALFWLMLYVNQNIFLFGQKNQHNALKYSVLLLRAVHCSVLFFSNMHALAVPDLHYTARWTVVYLGWVLSGFYQCHRIRVQWRNLKQQQWQFGQCWLMIIIIIIIVFRFGISLLAYDSVSDIGWIIAAQNRYFWCFR